MEIRDAGEADVADVQALVRQLFPNANFSLSEFRQESRRLVAVEREKVIGFLFGTLCYFGISSENYGFVELVVVDESHQRSGVGKDLVDQWKDWLRLNEVKQGFVSPKPGGGPFRFYESLGFRRSPGDDFMVWVDDRS